MKCLLLITLLFCLSCSTSNDTPIPETQEPAIFVFRSLVYGSELKTDRRLIIKVGNRVLQGEGFTDYSWNESQHFEVLDSVQFSIDGRTPSPFEDIEFNLEIRKYSEGEMSIPASIDTIRGTYAKFMLYN